jgi:hypothetical protein
VLLLHGSGGAGGAAALALMGLLQWTSCCCGCCCQGCQHALEQALLQLRLLHPAASTLPCSLLLHNAVVLAGKAAVMAPLRQLGCKALP